MDWNAVLTTVIGAGIGITATVIVDRNRWRRDASSRALEVRREAYTEFATAMNEAGEAIRAISLGDQASEAARDSLVREAFRASGVHAALERVQLVAPTAVGAAAFVAFRSMRRLRDQYAAGKDPKEPEAHALRKELEENFRTLRTLMRRDMGTEDN
ncbi:hypothetical protein [Streptomyces sp. GbtcB6]|uniref:hypothetical protein n=1 Tax=Streptomyces sp. GbtcB6 TaxID=2824751 RepID=UPI001C304163|nr:hypothetical protein [Streptomyces sp. GbtcB6]